MFSYPIYSYISDVTVLYFRCLSYILGTKFHLTPCPCINCCRQTFDNDKELAPSGFSPNKNAMIPCNAIGMLYMPTFPVIETPFDTPANSVIQDQAVPVGAP